MSAHRLVGVALLVATASCAHRAPNTQAEAKSGPKASIYANYTGGVIDRMADATFKVERGAYVLVGHLGGDGKIEVIYPEDARSDGYVPGGKWFRTPSFAAYYDAVPQMYSFATTRFRGVGARQDSYDGLGNGFLFIVASRSPLRFDRISEYGMWNDYEAPNYTYSNDPRSAVRTFSEMLAGRTDYTLQFAHSMSSTSFTSAINQSLDCAYLQSFSYGALLIPFQYQFGYLGLFSPFSYLGGCGGNQYALNDYSQRYGFAPQPITPRSPDGTGRWFRPGFNPRDKDTPTLGFNRPTHRTPTTGTSTSTTSTSDAFSTRRRGLAPRSGEVGGRDDARPAPRSPRSSPFESPRYSPRSSPSSGGSAGSSAGSSGTRAASPAVQPTHVQPVTRTQTEKPAEQRKPQR